MSVKGAIRDLVLAGAAVLCIYKVFSSWESLIYSIASVVLIGYLAWNWIEMISNRKKKSAAPVPAAVATAPVLPPAPAPAPTTVTKTTRVVQIVMGSEDDGNQYLGLGPEWEMFDYEIEHAHADDETPGASDAKVKIKTRLIVTRMEKIPVGRGGRVAEVRTLTSLSEANKLLQSGTAWDLDDVQFLVCEATDEEILMIVLFRYETEEDRERLSGRDVGRPGATAAN